ncbi:Nitroreductase-like protein [Xylariales sp. PMI_506]|nr:Nitroreductase-like protein [Xylariales sp. PMI_506]
MAAKITTDQWLEAASYRRTVYGLKDTSPVSDERIEEILKKVLSFAPSSYNTQSARFTLVLGEKHKQLWDIVAKESEEILKGAGPGIWEAMDGRFKAFRAAYGSVVFWENQKTIQTAAETHKASAHMFPEWSEHASGIHQILVWTALELEGFGANLQHMNAIPPVETALKKFLEVPDEYKLRAHLNFGEEAQPHPEIPTKLPTSETLKIVK